MDIERSVRAGHPHVPPGQGADSIAVIGPTRAGMVLARAHGTHLTRSSVVLDVGQSSGNSK